MSFRAKVSDFFIDHRGPDLLLGIACVVIVILMVRDVMAVF